MRSNRLLSLGLFIGLATAATASAQVKVGIANPVRIFSEMQESKDISAKLQNDRKQLETTEKEKRARLETLQQERAALKPDSPQYAAKSTELDNATVELTVWLQINQVSYQRAQKVQMRNVFDKIVDAVREVAQAKQLDVVLTDQKPELPEGETLDKLNLDQVRAIINSRSVLYSNPTIDITTEVVQHLDKKYREGK